MDHISAGDIIAKKCADLELSPREVSWFINKFMENELGDHHMAALLTAIYINGLSYEETATLTDVMLNSGEVLKFDDKTVVDKHSTGGVGDKTSFVLAPVAAACGVKVPMISGRSLGHTGGTADKIESIKGFSTTPSLDQFVSQVKEHGIALISQTEEIAPADRRIYALRHAISTVASIPLITASIMSKKLAEGASGIVIDIKWGSGAFMKGIGDAQALAKSLSQTATRCNHNVMTIISDMNQPLGKSIGHSLEIIECVEVLKGNGPEDLRTLSLNLAGGMIFLAGLSKDHKSGIAMAEDSVKDGRALNKFRELVKLQGGDGSFIDDYNILPNATERTEVTAKEAGYVCAMDVQALGNRSHRLAQGLSGGFQGEGQIDYAPGLVINKKLGDSVEKGDSLLTIHHHKEQSSLVDELSADIAERDYQISNEEPRLSPLIVDSHISWVQS